MKTITGSLIIAFLLSGTSIFSQVTQPVGKDTLVSFTVYGACVQCKDRIEKAAKIKGVRSAYWDENTKLLSLLLSPAMADLNKIKNRIAAVGHDLEDRKAPDAVYNALPACCLYRKMPKPVPVNQSDPINQVQKDSVAIKPVNQPTAVDLHEVKGVVLETDSKGRFKALAGASVIWSGTNKGGLTDSSGVFRVSRMEGQNDLVVSYAGYRSDTLRITGTDELRIILASDKKLREVTVTSKMRSTYVSGISSIRTQVMIQKELFKAACCNLSESFETNPSVDVSYSDAVTGAKQIQLLGLSGIYTQLTVENLPGPRGIATSLGLNSIAGPWVESIQLTKGIGSVANGFESIAGQINVELKKPESGERLFANTYVNDFGKTDINLNLSAKVGKKWVTALLLHDDFLFNKSVDGNRDGFRDLPSGNQFSAINRWKYDDGKGWMIQAGVKMLNDDRTGGELSVNPSTDKLTPRKYGLGISTQRYEGFAKIGYVFPQKKYKSIGLQLATISHRQDAYFGLTTYDARQETVYANLIYQSIIGSTKHKFRMGTSFAYDRYREDYRLVNYDRTEAVPGVFFEYTWAPLEQFTVVAGLRADHNSLFGFFATPRLHIRYEPVSGTTIRLSAGRGQRTANIFAENTSLLVSSRPVSIIGGSTGKAYGLDPEVAWNKGISIDQKFKLFQRDGLFSVDFFRNDFSNQVIADQEDPAQLRFYNLSGRSYSNSFQAELSVEPLKSLELRLAYRYFDVKTTYSGKLMQKPLVAKNRAFANLAYGYRGWKFDYTFNLIGQKRIPGTATNPPAYQRRTQSPAYVLMNAQVSKSLGKKYPMDFYIGAENLSDFKQRDAIIAGDQPFSPYFDASLVWGPVTGRMIYLGWRFRLK
ncbi:MAG: TonB-dependent receptor [Chitinophagaceae bacterium]|nr:TonB-dependent receptor [Chitinophagaceae bacterium]